MLLIDLTALFVIGYKRFTLFQTIRNEKLNYELEIVFEWGGNHGNK